MWINGYSIETYTPGAEYIDISDDTLDNDAAFSAWLTSYGAQVQEIVFPLYSSGGTLTGTYLHIPAFYFMMYTGSAGDYVKGIFNGSVAEDIKQSVYSIGTSNLNNNYIRDYDNSSHYVSLRDFLMNGAYATTRAVSSGQQTLDVQKRLVGGLVASYNESTDLISLTNDYYTDLTYSAINVFLPYRAVINSSSSSISSMTDYTTYFRPLHHSYDWIFKTIIMEVPTMAKQRITLAQAEALPEVTLRELQSAVYETACQYGQLSRVTDLFSGVELNGGGLYPAETLYPADTLYPNDGTGGEGLHPYPSEYSQLWTDTMGEQSFRYLIITYKTLDENNSEVDAVLQRTVNANGTTDYNMSDNWIFRNLVWTAADVGDYADAMVTKMQDIHWFPFEMWAAGLPYVETGDAIEITDRDGATHNSYILQRQLQGIQNLQDTYINGELDIF